MGRPKGSKNKSKEPGIGHNSQVLEADRHELHRLVDRIEALEADKRVVADDIKDIYTEAKDKGFDVPALRQIIKLRKQAKEQRESKQAIIDAYMHALGELADTPLGQAAVNREFGEARPF